MKNTIRLRYFLISLLSLKIIISCSVSATITKKSLNEHIDNPVSLSDGFIWGINGHPVEDRDYVPSPIQTQLKLLKEHQMTYYRVDVNTSFDGKLKSIDNRVNRFQELLDEAKRMNIKILPVLKFYRDHFENKIFNENEAFESGRNQARIFATYYKDYFDYYAIGNELDIRTQISNTSGNLKTDFKKEEVKLLASYFKGMIAGIKEVDPTAKTIINTAGDGRWGYLDLLNEFNVEYDILGYHWYSDGGNPLIDSKNPYINIMKKLEDYKKPIWLTEVSKRKGSMGYSELQQSEIMDQFIVSLNNYTHIKAIFIYELYDQPNLANAAWAGPHEAHYGIVGWETNPPNYSEYYYKPVSKLLKFRIEESNHGYEDYIQAVWADLYGEEPSQDNIIYWVGRFQAIKNKELVLKEMINKKESGNYLSKMETTNQTEFSIQIQSIYQSFLERKSAEGELKYWNRQLKKRMELQDLPIKILLSEEYWENAIWKGYEKRTGFSRPR